MNTTKKILLDSWQVSGTKNMNRLIDTLDTLTSITKLCPCRTNQIQIMTVSEVNDKDICGFLHNSISGTQNHPMAKDALMKHDGLDDDLANETENVSHTLFKLGNGVFFSSKKVLRTLCQRAGTNMGDFALRDELNIRFHRDAGYVAYMGTVPSQCQILFREVDNAKKIFAVFADRYRIIPQNALFKSILSDFEKELGKASLSYYSVSNAETEIYLEFPKKAKDFSKVYNLKDTLIPGLRINMSDIGESSFIINGYLRINNSITYIPGANYSRAHTKNAELDAIIENVGKAIFTEYTKIPERLMELLSIDIKDAEQLIPKVLRYCNIKKDFGAKIENAILENLIATVNPALNYTAYDIALMIVDSCTEFEENHKREFVSKMRNCSSKAIFYRYEN